MRYLMLLALVGQAHAAVFSLTENSIKTLSLKANPSLAEIESTFLSSKVAAKELTDKFGYEAYGKYENTQTNEKALVPFFPVYRTINQYKVGVKKYTKYGVVLDLNTSVDTRSGGSTGANALTFNNVTTTIQEFGIQVDLWKDFMGRISKSQFNNLNDLAKKDEYQASISKAAFVVNMRKLYWRVVANQEKINITKNLAQKADQQLKDARERRRQSIADKAEVARFESLVHQRKGNLISLRYEREMLFKELKNIFPDLNEKKLELGEYNADKTLFEILSCSTQIQKETEVPYGATDYDEVAELLRNVQSRQIEIDETYDDVDIKFDLKLRQVGVASNPSGSSLYEGSYQEALEDIADNNRSAMVAGLMVTLPFGEDLSETKSVKVAYTEKSFAANIHNLESQVKATHSQTQNTVGLLTALMKEQKLNSKQLSIRVKEMKRKYAQARIPEYALIQDEDSLLQSDLGVVDVKLQVINTVLDYLSVFHNYPCSFNRVSK